MFSNYPLNGADPASPSAHSGAAPASPLAHSGTASASSSGSASSRGGGPDDLSCPKCHSEEFSVEDTRTGQLRCAYCRNRWIDERFIQKTETERFLEQQAKQPRIVLDNTTETDRQLMQALGGLSSIASVFTNPLRGCRSIIVTYLKAFFRILILLAIAAGIIVAVTYWISTNNLVQP
ncbi:MAG: TFIIB-type zinc ribbon-containing protein [Coriobacteriales bacterium]|jgi:hypothetical protein|nr:TFIIB-type zinc ribbon-containing protein [Coriobacteriales bacterium]